MVVHVQAGSVGGVMSPRVPGLRVLAVYVVLLSTLTSVAWLASALYGMINASRPGRDQVLITAIGIGLVLGPYPWLLWRALMRRTAMADRLALGGVLAAAGVLVVACGHAWVMALACPAALLGVVWTYRAGLAVVMAGMLSLALLGYGLFRGWPMVPTLFNGVYIVAAAFSGAMTVWFCHVVEELGKARTELASQAVGEERQRFARDLHDVLGHSLQAVALRAELAERMIDRDPGRVAKELAEIQVMARGAVKDVREVVRGYRATSLRTELEGMAAVLHAAGIGCPTPPIPPDLPRHVHEALGWVARESATNVLRHSAATWCSLSVVAEDGRVRLEIVNDGAVGLRGDGSGLAGLAERISGVGGVFEAGPAGDGTFRVAAEVPLVPQEATR